jgi:hypothetical protein
MGTSRAYQIQLFVDAVSAHRARGGAGPMLGGSSRTLIKLAQQLISTCAHFSQQLTNKPASL